MALHSIESVTAANKEWYDLVANDYLSTESYAYTSKITKSVIDNLTLCSSLSPTSDNFLDLGCGSGFLSKLCSENNLFKSGSGVDISESQIKLYNDALIGSSFKGVVGDSYNLPFDDATFDCVGGYSVLHHFYDYNKVISESLRVLKPGGVLYFDFEPNSRFRRRFKSLVKFHRLIKSFISKKSDVDLSSEANEVSLESVAEWHNNATDGISYKKLSSDFDDQFKTIKVGARYPDTFMGNVTATASLLIRSKAWPLFYIVGKKSN